MRCVAGKTNGTRSWLVPTVAAVLAAPAAGPVAAEQRCYTDRANEICFPLGPLSFADAVVALEMGEPKAQFAGAMIPEAALGEPDNDLSLENETDIPQKYVTIGCRGTLILQFLDNVLKDVPGSDLYVFEIGDDVEPTRLAISGDNIDWTEIGDIKGGLAEVDIGPFVRPGDVFRYVRLTDLGARCGSRWPGADIDAVGAIGASPESDPYADEVVGWQVGEPRWTEGPSDPGYALDAPDHAGDHMQPTLATLGCGGQVTLRFTDNDLVDGPGDDLRVYEPGDREGFRTEISVDGQSWRHVGDSRGGNTTFDIADVSEPGERFYFVRITDLRQRCVGTRPGADVDAVEALNAGAGSGNRRPELLSVEIVDPDSLDPVEEIAVGGRFRVRLTYAGDLETAITETVTIGTGRQGSLDMRVTGDTRVIVSDPITVSPTGQ